MSRLPSSRGSSSTSSRSTPVVARRPGVVIQSPKSDIYVAMLGIALAAIVISCILMLMIFSRYSFSTKVARLETGTPAVQMARVAYDQSGQRG